MQVGGQALTEAGQAFTTTEALLREALLTDPKNADWQRMLLVARQQHAWVAWLLVPDARARSALADVVRDLGAPGESDRSRSELRTLRSVAHSRLAFALLKDDASQALVQARTAHDMMSHPPQDTEPEADQYARALAAMAYGDALSATRAREAATGIWQDALSPIEAAAPAGVSLRVLDLAAQLRARLDGGGGAVSLRDQLTRTGFLSPRLPQPPVMENP